ncbi:MULTISPECIES: hypothetical protein [Rhizobium]|uniref:hypothetical protein n=1 Tax=Rhizobium TaxID=379 RepID=UPI0021B0D0B4|nr:MULTISPECIES: hypothetical protein [Rhizobium]
MGRGNDLPFIMNSFHAVIGESELPVVTSINRRRGRVEIFRRYVRQGLTCAN